MTKTTNEQFTGRDIPALLVEYVNAAQVHGEATRSGDYHSANIAYETIAGVYRELRSRGLEAQNRLLNLLNHEDFAVRSWAASHALEFAPQRGLPVLEALSDGQGIWRLEAITTIKEWKKGSLKFP